MTSYEVNTFVVDLNDVLTLEDVDNWLDRISPVLDGYIQERDGTWSQVVLHNRVKVKIDRELNKLLDRRLELMDQKEEKKQTGVLCTV